MEQLIISLITGAVGGNVAGALLKKLSLGGIGNTIVGIIGGAGGSQLLSMLSSGAGEGLVGNIAGSGVGGAVLLAIVGVVKKALGK